MRYNFSYFIKRSLIIVLLLQAGRICGQTKIDYTFGASTSFVNGTMNIPASRNNTDVSFGCSQLDFFCPWLDNNNYAQVNFTTPVANVVVEFWGADDGDVLRLDVNGVIYPITLAMLSCGFVTCTSYSNCGSPTITNGTVTNAGPNAYRLTIAPTTPITSFRITNTAGTTGFGLSNFTYKFCPAGTSAPTLSKTTSTNVCPGVTINLDSLVTSNLPSGAALRWFSNNTATGTALTNTSAVTTAGTYYAYYYDPTSNCYTAASAAVTVTLTACCPPTSPIVN